MAASTTESEPAALVKWAATDSTDVERAVISVESAPEMAVSTAASELEAAVRLDAAADTAVERAVISVESEFEMSVPIAVSEAAVLVRLDSTVDTAAERNVVSVASAVEIWFSLVTPLAVSEMLELVWSSVAISPSVSSADGAVPIRVLMAVLIALLR